MNYKFKTKPYAHQLKALEMSWNKEVFAYFMEMGTGKSKVLLDNVAMLFDKGKINSVLIVAPRVFIKIGMTPKYQNIYLNTLIETSFFGKLSLLKSKNLSVILYLNRISLNYKFY